MWNDDERDRFFKQLAVVAETLGEPMSPVRLAGYCDALEDLPLDPVSAGLRKAMRECRFFPKPAEIREMAKKTAEWGRHLDRERAARMRLLGPGDEPGMDPGQSLARLSQMIKAALAKRVMP